MAMGSLKSVAAAAILAISALAAPTNELKRSACKITKYRNPWSKMTSEERKAYIDAEICVMHKPPRIPLRGAKTLFDEFQALHIMQSELAHFVGSFLTWHRAFIWAHEVALVTECSYTGAQPYWEESLDAGHFMSSDVLDSVTGFGGNGAGLDRCIQDGPFSWYNNSLGPGYQITNHCITRNVNEMFSRAASRTEVERCMRATTFEAAWNCIEGSPHSAGHGGVGAQMINGRSSPGDPVFYLHHAWIDKLWWDWQKQDLPARLSEMGGRNRWPAGGPFGGGNNGTPGSFEPPSSGVSGGFFGSGGPDVPGFDARPDDVAEPHPQGDDGGSVVTLGHVNQMLGMIPDIVTADLMDIRTGPMCYEYVDAS